MIVLTLCLTLTLPNGIDEFELIEVDRIWDEAPHNAFTDLIRHSDHWFCAFREGAGHVSPDGAIRVIVSSDGKDWEPAARLTHPMADLRDPKLCQIPDGRLMLVAVAAMHPPAAIRHQTMVWFSTDGRTWDEGHAVGHPNVWIWRVTWGPDDAAYGIGYATVEPRATRLYRAEDGLKFVSIVPELSHEGSPNEATVRFLPDGTALALQRREAGSATGWLGRSRPPYLEWQWIDLGRRIGGPNFLRLPDGRLIAAVRLYDGQVRTSLCRIDPTAGIIEEVLKLPSGGDTSYAGLAWHDDRLWVSYYSSHEGKSNIYLAQIRVPSGDG